MRKEEINLLSQPYSSEKDEIDRRFNAVIEADVPSAKKLVQEILNDLDVNSFGINWWNSLPPEERILISDYLFQCASGVEVNLMEAKLHYFEWLHAVENHNKKIVNIVTRDSLGGLIDKMPKSNAPVDDLPLKLENLHLCGFFRAIGSSLDCLGATIIGVLALPCSKRKPLRKSDIAEAQNTLKNLTDLGTSGSKLQMDFGGFFESVKNTCGPKDWLEWADQYRNMYVHRGRRTIFNKISAKKQLFYDSKERFIPRFECTTHLGKFPDRSEAEAFIRSEEAILFENAEITLTGIFESCRTLNEKVCEQLLFIWKERRNNPSLLEQPQNQWNDIPKHCDFTGYDMKAEKFDMSLLYQHPNFLKRMRSASVFGELRNFWNNSRWS